MSIRHPQKEIQFQAVFNRLKSAGWLPFQYLQHDSKLATGELSARLGRERRMGLLEKKCVRRKRSDQTDCFYWRLKSEVTE